MKTNFFKIVLPVVITTMAVVSAFAFSKNDTKELFATESGWINLPDNPCAIEVSCSNIPSDFVCTAAHAGTTYQVYGKNNPQIMICAKILFRL